MGDKVPGHTDQPGCGQPRVTGERRGPAGIRCDLASISPKLSNSTPPVEAAGAAWLARHERTRIHLECLREWLDAYPYQLKFVVSAAECLVDKSDVSGITAATDVNSCLHGGVYSIA